MLKVVYVILKYLRRLSAYIYAERIFIVLAAILSALSLELSMTAMPEESCNELSHYIFYSSSRINMECIERRNQIREAERSHELKVIKAEQNSELMSLLAKSAIDKNDVNLEASFLGYLGLKDPDFLLALGADPLVELRKIITKHLAEKDNDSK